MTDRSAVNDRVCTLSTSPTIMIVLKCQVKFLPYASVQYLLVNDILEFDSFCWEPKMISEENVVRFRKQASNSHKEVMWFS